MQNFWLDWQTPWTRLQCEIYYLYNAERPTLRTIVAMSGRSIQALSDWSSKFDWLNKREKVEEEISSMVGQALTQTIALDRFELAKQHFEACRIVRAIAVDYFQRLQKLSERDLFKVKPMDVNYWSMILDRAIEGERAALGLKMIIDVNAAIETLHSLGYVISKPDGETIEAGVME